jgi:hypothetical protein
MDTATRRRGLGAATAVAFGFRGLLARVVFFGGALARVFFFGLFGRSFIAMASQFL